MRFDERFQSAEIILGQQGVHLLQQLLGFFFLSCCFPLLSLSFDEVIDAVAFVAVLVVDHRVVEIIDVSAGFPSSRMHENGRVKTNDILLQLCHTPPPMVLDVLFQLAAHLTVVIDRLESVVDLTTGKNEPVFLAMCDDRR